MAELTHLDERGHARMVDVTAKPWTRRVAVARGRVATTANLTDVFAATAAGLDPLCAAREAGVSAAKRAWDLIPLCHPIQLIDVDVVLALDENDIRIEATTVVVAPTGVEMEALSAVMFAGLSLVQFLKRVDPQACVTDVGLWSKTGGKSGDWERGRRLSARAVPQPPTPARDQAHHE